MGLSDFLRDVNDSIVSVSEKIYSGIDGVVGKNPVTDTFRSIDSGVHDFIDDTIDGATGVAEAATVGNAQRVAPLTPQEICSRKDELRNIGIDPQNRYGSTKSIFEACATGSPKDLGVALEAAGRQFTATVMARENQRLGR